MDVTIGPVNTSFCCTNTMMSARSSLGWSSTAPCERLLSDLLDLSEALQKLRLPGYRDPDVHHLCALLTPGGGAVLQEVLLQSAAMTGVPPIPCLHNRHLRPSRAKPGIQNVEGRRASSSPSSVAAVAMLIVGESCPHTSSPLVCFVARSNSYVGAAGASERRVSHVGVKADVPYMPWKACECEWL